MWQSGESRDVGCSLLRDQGPRGQAEAINVSEALGVVTALMEGPHSSQVGHMMKDYLPPDAIDCLRD